MYIRQLAKFFPQNSEFSDLRFTICFLRSITKADLQNYISTHYSAPRIVLAAAGGVDHDQLSKLADDNFKNLKTTYSEEEQLKPCRFTGSEVSN